MPAQLFLRRLILSVRALPGLENGILNVTTYDKFLPQEFLEKFQKDTGIEVRIRLTDDQGKQYNLLTAEGANPSTDIVTVAGHRYSQFINSKLLQPLDTCKISNWKNLNTAYQDAPWARSDGNLWGLPILAGYEGLARNVDYVKDAPSWEIMFDPEYKGQTSYIVSDFMDDCHAGISDMTATSSPMPTSRTSPRKPPTKPATC